MQGNYQLTSQSQVKDDPLLLIHFVLTSISTAANPALLMNEMLKGFLGGELVFQYREIKFDLSNDTLLASHEHILQNLLCEVRRYLTPTFVFFEILLKNFLINSFNFHRVIVFITNHSHHDSGNMYLGPNLCAPVDNVSISI